MSAVNTTWEGETDAASDGSPSFTSVKLTPHRLTTVVPISKQFILQDSAGAEAAIREEIINAINTKLEATILGNAAATTTKPGGFFADATKINDVESYADVCELEAEVETNNVYGNMKYILSPKAKSALRSMIKGTNGTGMVFEAGEVDGTDALVTSNVPTGKYVYGDFSNYIIASWGNIDLTVDNITLAASGQIRLVVNAYFDAKPLRANAFALGSLFDESTSDSD
jgi:HK97 family phage major capsid protein